MTRPEHDQCAESIDQHRPMMREFMGGTSMIGPKIPSIDDMVAAMRNLPSVGRVPVEIKISGAYYEWLRNNLGCLEGMIGASVFEIRIRIDETAQDPIVIYSDGSSAPISERKERKAP